MSVSSRYFSPIWPAARVVDEAKTNLLDVESGMGDTNADETDRKTTKGMPGHAGSGRWRASESRGLFCSLWVWVINQRSIILSDK
jgi:hypothetical protein